MDEIAKNYDFIARTTVIAAARRSLRTPVLAGILIQLPGGFGCYGKYIANGFRRPIITELRVQVSHGQWITAGRKILTQRCLPFIQVVVCFMVVTGGLNSSILEQRCIGKNTLSKMSYLR
jgi:hypothetical protein